MNPLYVYHDNFVFNAILSARIDQSKEDAHMKDKELITNATQLLSELNKSFQSCKQGRADDIRLQELLNATM